MGLPEKELLSNLSFLKDAELLYERGVYPQSSYIFKHALTREVVYDSILSKRKIRFHEEIGKAIEVLRKDSLREYFEVLAEHYFSSENYSKGAEYFRLASRKAEKAALLNDAIVHEKKRVISIERLPRTVDVEKKMIDARVALGLYLAQMSLNTEAKEVVDPIIDLAMNHDYKRRLCHIYTIIGTYYLFVEDNYSKAFQVLEDALKISEEINDIVGSVLVSWGLGFALSFNCEFEKAFKHFRNALEINLAAKNVWGISAMKSNLAIFYYNFSGKTNVGFKTSEESLLKAEESEDILSRAVAYGSHGVCCYGKGFLKEAENNLLKGVGFCEKINLNSYNYGAQFHLGETYYESGNFEKSKEHYEKGISVLEKNRLLPSWAGLARVGVARSKILNKERDVNLESMPAHFRNNKVKAFEGWIQRYIGEIFLNVDDQHFSEAEHWIRGAIEADRRNGMMLLLGRDHALCAELFKRKGDRSRSQEHLGKAMDIYKECGADGWLKKAEEELAALP